MCGGVKSTRGQHSKCVGGGVKSTRVQHSKYMGGGSRALGGNTVSV